MNIVTPCYTHNFYGVTAINNLLLVCECIIYIYGTLLHWYTLYKRSRATLSKENKKHKKNGISNFYI